MPITLYGIYHLAFSSTQDNTRTKFNDELTDFIMIYTEMETPYNVMNGAPDQFTYQRVILISLSTIQFKTALTQQTLNPWYNSFTVEQWKIVRSCECKWKAKSFPLY